MLCDSSTDVRATDQSDSRYKEKSGNEWSERKNFVKKPGKYLPIEVEADTEEPTTASAPHHVQNAAAPASSFSSRRGGPKVDEISGHASDVCIPSV